MTAEAGLGALWLAAAMALLQLVLAVVGWRLSTSSVRPELVEGPFSFSASGEEKDGAATGSARAAVLRALPPIAIVGGVLAAMSFLCLILVFLATDLSVLPVAQNSHSAKPWLEKAANAWGSREGAMLLCVTLVGIAGAMVARCERRSGDRRLIETLGVQAAIALGVYAFLLFGSGPFTRIDPPPADGNGLNPLLHDPGLAFHPTALVVAIGVAVASLAPYWMPGWRRAPLGTWGMAVTVAGVGVALFGVVSDAAFTRERLIAARPGQRIEVGPFRVVFDGIKPVIGPSWSALEGRLSITRGSGEPFVLRPQQRYVADPPMATSAAAIATRIDGQLYATIGAPAAGGRWQVRLWWKPFVTFIWLGGVLIAVGGALSLIGRRRRERHA